MAAPRSGRSQLFGRRIRRELPVGRGRFVVRVSARDAPNYFEKCPPCGYPMQAKIVVPDPVGQRGGWSGDPGTV